MTYDFAEEAINKFELKGVIKFISDKAGETMLSLVALYESYYGLGKTNEGFIKHCLAQLFACHKEGSNFERRTDIAEEQRRRILQEVVLSKIYHAGEEWLRENNYANKIPRY
jgi:hypothetical protein